MPRRQIGQEHLTLGSPRARGGSSLDEAAALVDWTELERLLAGVSASAKGEPGWPPVALFRALLLAMWHDLSDVRLAEALDDRTSFRRFCGFAASEPTPERTAFVRFRAELVRRGLDRALFEAITRQLDARGVVVRTGTLVDATLIPSASIRHDHGARWAGHRRRKPLHGYKAHVATDQEAGLIAVSRSRPPTSTMRRNSAPFCPRHPATPTATARSPAANRKRPSVPAADDRASCTPAPGAVPRHSLGCRRTMPRCAGYAPGSKRYSARRNVPTACGACAGSVWRRPGCRSA